MSFVEISFIDIGQFLGMPPPKPTALFLLNPDHVANLDGSTSGGVPLRIPEMTTLSVTRSGNLRPSS